MAKAPGNGSSLLILSTGAREELTRWSQSRTALWRSFFRARLILALANGFSYRENEPRLDTALLRCDGSRAWTCLR
jgi:hypothetical protein